ncbi:pyroglutamyl-peptidase I [Evansella sp. AB-rgal1]|uniref:pyroglutamyl-peptidase I n=1 Tax=Evansella sp. AB-rgal1 TaxID=3242696 RepID=UPI00359E23D1
MKKIIVSGFEPFGGLTTNPTMEIIARINGWKVDNAEIHTIILPVVYNDCATRLIKYIDELKPNIVISLGVALGRSVITPERIGVNIQDTVGEGYAGDNEGDKPQDRLIVENGPDGIFSTLPNRRIIDKLQEKGIPASISNTAGAYICNNTLYSVLHYIKENNLSISAGFIHVPATPEMVTNKVNVPSMSIDLQEEAIRLAIEGCLEGAE